MACPHYTCEALLYLALALLFASNGWNGTAGLLALWVVANLGVTAEKTRRWYRQRFVCVYVRARCEWRRLFDQDRKHTTSNPTGFHGSSRPRARPWSRVFGSVWVCLVGCKQIVS